MVMGAAGLLFASCDRASDPARESSSSASGKSRTDSGPSKSEVRSSERSAYRPDPAHDAAVRLAKEDPARLLAIITSGKADPETGLGPERAESYLRANCRDWQVITSMVVAAKGEHQIELAEEAVGAMLMDGDLESVRRLVDQMPPGEARWRAAGLAIQSEVVSTGPAKALPALQGADKDALAKLLPELEEGTRNYFLEHPGEQPLFEDYAGASQEALQRVVTGYLRARGGQDPGAALDWLAGLEGTSADPLLKPALMAWVRSVTTDYDEATVLAALELAEAHGAKAEVSRELMERVSTRQPELAESLRKREKK
jgi:hypothetical protein